MLVALGEYLDVQPAVEAASSATVVTVVADPFRDTASPGGEFQVILNLQIKPGWHAYANPTGVAEIPPTRVTLAEVQGASIVKVDYPAGEMKLLASSGKEKVAVYEGKQQFVVHLKIDPATKAGALNLRLTVQYQACDDRSCLAPAKLEVIVPVMVGH